VRRAARPPDQCLAGRRSWLLARLDEKPRLFGGWRRRGESLRAKVPYGHWKTLTFVAAAHRNSLRIIGAGVVPTLSFRLLYGLLIPRHGRRQILLAGGDGTPERRLDCPATHRSGRPGVEPKLHCPHDRIYGEIFTWRLRATGVRDRPIAPKSPWQNSHAQRLTGVLGRECFDVVVFGERRCTTYSFCVEYYNGSITTARESSP
jgi:hypothetical protein